jgi:hypothetical protein
MRSARAIDSRTSVEDFDPYLSRFDQSSGAARDWFLEHLV